jgi:hypothetical protein
MSIAGIAGTLVFFVPPKSPVGALSKPRRSVANQVFAGYHFAVVSLDKRWDKK